LTNDNINEAAAQYIRGYVTFWGIVEIDHGDIVTNWSHYEAQAFTRRLVYVLYLLKLTVNITVMLQILSLRYLVTKRVVFACIGLILI